MPIPWAGGQLEIMDCILNRYSPDMRQRIHVMTPTQYGKSLAVGAAVAARASIMPEKWAIVAGTSEKAQIIMDYAIMFSLNDPIMRQKLLVDTPLDRLRRERSRNRLTYVGNGEIRVFSADSRNRQELGNALMGFGAPNVIEDESALIPDDVHAKVMRMLGGSKDNFMMKIGNPFNRNHFLRSYHSDRYYKIEIDWHRALEEGRFTMDYISEMQEEAFFAILYEVKFPEEGMIDSKGWMNLLTDADIERAFSTDLPALGGRRLGCDVAGGGRNFSVIVLRNYNVAKKIYKTREPDTMIFAGNVIHMANQLGVKDGDIYVDKIGLGKGAYDRIREMKSSAMNKPNQPLPSGIAGSEQPADTTRYNNLRAEMYWRAREWILHGGKLDKDDDWYQLAQIKYKIADSSGKIKMMSKEEMLREAIDSPDVADAFALTFARYDSNLTPAYTQEAQVYVQPVNPDPYD
ncbi:MAG: hypothetical protein NUV73_04465 [Candidatus Daviesbacteria bacterium]|nr:hypothetical protein [Candidatus Daviesbacteria bacterium]